MHHAAQAWPHNANTPRLLKPDQSPGRGGEDVAQRKWVDMLQGLAKGNAERLVGRTLHPKAHPRGAAADPRRARMR